MSEPLLADLEDVCKKLAESSVIILKDEFGSGEEHKVGLILFLFTMGDNWERQWMTFATTAERNDVLRALHEFLQKADPEGEHRPAPASTLAQEQTDPLREDDSDPDSPGQ